MSTTRVPPDGADATSAPGLAPWQARKVLRLIDEHPGQPLTIRDLAKGVGLSAGHFSRRFKGSFGISPRRWVIHDRLERAKTLMQGTRSPLSQIAADCGFSDQSHLSRSFRAIVGSSPHRWRREQASSRAT